MRKEVPVRNNPGITKILKLDKRSGTWKETGKFRAVRRIGEHGERQQSVFESFEDARAFKYGEEGGTPMSEPHQPQKSVPTFSDLLRDWKKFHYLQLEKSSQQMYETRLPQLSYLNSFEVEAINTSVIDDLVSYWVTELPKGRQRETFHKELDLLKVILNFYRKRKNPAYGIPILDEHYKAADVAKKAERPVQSLSMEELGKFLECLKVRYPNYYGLALSQFSFGLRIGEACALKWSFLDLKNRVATIEETVVWHHSTWKPEIKRRKNGKTLILVIPDLLVEELERLKRRRNHEVDLIFHRDGQFLNRHQIGKAYNRALKAIGVKYVTGTHLLRKTSATLANETTGDFYAVSKLLDHSSPDITLKYVSQTSAQKRKVASALNGILEGALGKPTEPTKTHNFCGEKMGADPQKPTNEASKKFRLVKSNF